MHYKNNADQSIGIFIGKGLVSSYSDQNPLYFDIQKLDLLGTLLTLEFPFCCTKEGNKKNTQVQIYSFFSQQLSSQFDYSKTEQFALNSAVDIISETVNSYL